MFDSISGVMDVVKAFVAAYPEFIVVVGELITIIVNLLRQVKALKTPKVEILGTKATCTHSHTKTLMWACLPWNLFRKTKC